MTGSGSRVIVVGLGPGNPDLRTVGAQRALDAADRIILRTRIHPGISDFATDPKVTDCDDLYESADGFADLYQAIAARVVTTARAGGIIVFAVPGHPRFGEWSVPLIEAKAAEFGIPVDVLDAVSFVDVALGALQIDPIEDGLQVTDAEHLAATLDSDPYAAGLLGVDPARALLVAQVYNSDLAAAVKIALTRLYPDEHLVVLVNAAGILAEQTTISIALHTLDRLDVDHLTSLWVPPLAPLDAVRSPESLTRIVARLRAPGGCPWDREQTHGSLRNAVLEEAYEVVDTIDGDDERELAEELGDLLLLVSMHAQLAEENGSFKIEDVYEEINRKLIRRHPHVFGAESAATPDEVIATWEGVKATERAEKAASQIDQHPIDRLPRAMPATRKAIQMLAPRKCLSESNDSSAGDDLLSAVSALVDRGLDPERALEASLRKLTKQRVEEPSALSATGVGSSQGRRNA